MHSKNSHILAGSIFGFDMLSTLHLLQITGMLKKSLGLCHR